MATLGDDCYFFCTSTCVKGSTCQFRHVEAAKTCKIICQHWQMGNCFRPMCKFRHSTFPIPTSTTVETPCYWETQPVGCTRKTCTYKHLKPRPDSGLAQTPAVTEISGTVQSSSATSQIQPATTQGGKDVSEPKASPQILEAESATKQSSSDQNMAAQEGDKKLIGDDNENSNKENGSAVGAGTPGSKGDGATAVKPKVKKKVVKKAGVTKKTPGSAVKKTKVVKKVLVKKVKKVAKKANSETGDAVAEVAPERKSMKERLGIASAQRKPAPVVAPPAASESGSESSDSVDNIKVLSMEEILRQRALESMMKKRAAEGKPQPATEAAKVTKPAAVPTKAVAKKKPVGGNIAVKRKPAVSRLAAAPVAPLKKKKIIPVAAPESSESEEESSGSTGSSSEDSEDSEPDVRRVVVEVNDEVAARKRAKASLLKKQAGVVGGVQSGKVNKAKGRLGVAGIVPDKKLKRRMVNVDYDSDDIVSSRVKAPLNVRDRLGKPPMPQAASSSQPGEQVRNAVLKNSPTKASKFEREANSSEDDDDDDSLEGVKVKTLEEIRREKMKKSGAGAQEDGVDSCTSDSRVLSVKQRLGSASPVKLRTAEDDSGGSRQVLIAADTGSKSDEGSGVKPSGDQRKAKRRPWRSRKIIAGGEEVDQGEEDERTTVVIASDLARKADSPASRLDGLHEEPVANESPFARLKRRALQKKLQTLQQGKQSSLARNVIQEDKSEQGLAAADLDGENTQEPHQEEVEEGKNHKKHKHKHKHKHHKKSKKERQIYMPPALKHAAVEPVTQQQEEEVSPAATAAAPTIKVAPLRRGGPHKIAAAWSAGLSLSSKGSVHSARRPVEASSKPEVAVPSLAGVAGRLGPRPAEPVKKIVPLSASQPASEPTGAVIKSFSEIMAEKRRRRLEMQGKASGSAGSESSLASSAQDVVSVSSPTRSKPSSAISSPVRQADSRPRVPITPIVFNTDEKSSSPVKPKVKPSSLVPAQVPQQAVAPIKATSFSNQVAPTSKSNIFDSVALQPASQRLKAPPAQSDLFKPSEDSSNPALVNRSSKKISGQKKLFKKKKPAEQKPLVSVPSQDSSDSMAAMGISIPLPPMTLEEELLLDEGPSTAADDLRLQESDSQNNVPQPSVPLGLQQSRLDPPSEVAQPLMTQQTQQQQQQMLSEPSASPFSSAQVTVAAVAKHKLSTPDISEVSVKKTRLSIDDELALFEEDLEVFGSGGDDFIAGESVEPIDDLLQNIDDLLA